MSQNKTDAEGNLMKQQLFKTKVCRHFMSGRCKYGSGCTFAHSAVELQTRPDFRRTKLCSKLNCTDPGCGYAHSTHDIRDAYDVICPAWLAGQCVNGQACPLSHNSTHIEELAVAYRLENNIPENSVSKNIIPSNVSSNNNTMNNSDILVSPVATPTALYADVLLASLQLLAFGSNSPILLSEYPQDQLHAAPALRE
jgi:hypothetical protein